MDVYRKIGKISGDVFIVPRSQNVKSLPEIKQNSDEKILVIIYLSSVFSQDAVQRCVDALQSNPDVLCIGIKPHPRANHEFLHTIKGVTIHDSISSLNHVAIVPNSSVVIELLESGVPVFQYFELDDVGHDYYGFVREKITPEVSLNDLRNSFWASDFYNDQWVSKFADYSPSIDDSWREHYPALISKINSYM